MDEKDIRRINARAFNNLFVKPVERKKPKYRQPFEAFKSNVCHFVKSMGDKEFIKEVIKTDVIVKCLEKEWNLEALYMLAMVDYLCRENGIPLYGEYEIIRHVKMEEIIYPGGVIILSAAMNSEEPKERSLREAIPEFLRHNIVEAEVRNVC
jgi:hypothetical protein